MTTTNGESEKFLFIEASGMWIALCNSGARRTQPCWNAAASSGPALSNRQPMTVRHLWLASFRTGGACAFRTMAPVTLDGRTTNPDQAALFTVPAGFAQHEYSAANLSQLRAEMRLALQEEGMFPDEADALLNTWELSYFKSAGLRLFFMVPKAWTDWYLPLDISVPCDIKRAMVGRLELVTPEQRVLLKELARAPIPTKPWAYYEMTGKPRRHARRHAASLSRSRTLSEYPAPGRIPSPSHAFARSLHPPERPARSPPLTPAWRGGADVLPLSRKDALLGLRVPGLPRVDFQQCTGLSTDSLRARVPVQLGFRSFCCFVVGS